MENSFLQAVKIWAAMAWADGEISEEEAVAIKAIIKVGRLTDDERQTALGYLENKVELEADGVARLGADTRRTMYQSAARVAAIDKDVPDAERAFLERLRTALKLHDNVVRQVHDEVGISD